MNFAEPTSFDLAVDRIRSKSPVAAKLSADEWAQLQVGLRDRAFFSAHVESAKILARMQGAIDRALAPDGKDPYMSKDRFIATMREALGAAPGDSNQLTDITSGNRLGLIYDFQVEDAMEHGRWVAAQDPELLEAFPCQELVRVESRINPRDWLDRWAAAGGRFFGGRMIARKDDPVWEKISRFGRPWPPFDFGSGMGVEDIERDEAIELGVIEVATAVKPQQEDFNKSLEASIPIASPEVIEGFKNVFGDQVSVSRDGKVAWEGDRVRKLFDEALKDKSSKWNLSFGSASPKAVQAAPELAGTTLDISADTVRHIVKEHVVNEDDGSNRPLNVSDLVMIPQIWRSPDAVRPGKVPGSFELHGDYYGTSVMVIANKGDAKNPSTKVRVSTFYAKRKGVKP